MIMLSLTAFPFKAYHYLGTAESGKVDSVDYIVVMGAGGMPSPQGLMRCYYAAQAAKAFPEATIIITIPSDPGNFFSGDAFKMYESVVAFGVVSRRFIFEIKGTDTYSQAAAISNILKGEELGNLLIVTTPEHVYRSVLSFRKCGFVNVYGLPAFQGYTDDNLLYTPQEQEKIMKPLHRNLAIRYNLWNYLKLQIDVARELLALGYYKMAGYI
jgi:uncharacterized SAM-binding protein YcdF (DUF218 family)